MDRMVRARVLLEEAAAVGVTLDDLVAASVHVRGPASAVPTVAEYVDTIDKAMGDTTAQTSVRWEAPRKRGSRRP